MVPNQAYVVFQPLINPAKVLAILMVLNNDLLLLIARTIV